MRLLPVLALALVLAPLPRDLGRTDSGFEPLAGLGHSPGSLLDQIDPPAPGAPLTRDSGPPALITGRREVTGVGDADLLVDAPFWLSWQAEGGDFALSMTRLDDPPARAGADGGARVSSRTVLRLMQSVRAPADDYTEAGAGRGRISQTYWGRYEIRIRTTAPWRLTLRHR